MNLLNDIALGGKGPGKLLAEELKDVISPVTSQVEELSSRLERIETLLVQIDKSLKLLRPLAKLLSKIPFLNSPE